MLSLAVLDGCGHKTVSRSASVVEKVLEFFHNCDGYNNLTYSTTPLAIIKTFVKLNSQNNITLL